jgi:putative ABC transport system permease protein
MPRNVWFDLNYAWRLLCKSLGHSSLCTVVVALSVGLGIWAFEAYYSTALKPLPFPGTERWFSVQVAAKAADTPVPDLDAYTYQQLLKRNRTVDHLGAYASRAAVLSEGQASTSLRAASISPSLFSALRVTPHMGRLFESADSEPGAAPAAILSFATWQAYFAADPAIVGKQVRIDGQAIQIVGVMPRDFYAFQDFELWFPLQLGNLTKPGDSSLTLSPLIVLDKDQNADAILNEMKPVVEEINKNYPELFNAGRYVAIFSAHLMFVHDQLPFVAMIGFTAAAVLLLGCVNIGLVFFARLLERNRELALRAALGSSRWRLLRQCLFESGFVVFFGLLIGILLAALAIRWGQSISEFITHILATGRSPDYPTMRALDLLAAVIVATAIWLLSTLIPAWRIAKQDPAAVLAGGGKGVSGAGSGRSANWLVGLQVIISCLVLVICANLVLAIHEEASKPTGLHAEGIVLSSYPTVLGSRYAEASERLRYWDELSAAVKGRIADADVAYATAVPTRAAGMPAAIEHQEGAADQGNLKLPLAAISENYFALLGVTLRSGRMFDSTDNGNSLNVAIIDETTAQRYWPHEDALGKRIQLNPTERGPWLTVVGVVSRVGAVPFGDAFGVVYRPLRQALPAQFHLLAKVPPSASDARTVLRAAAYAVDRDVPLHNLQMLDEYLQALDISYKSIIPVFAMIATITVILAATGLFGLISRSVARRTQEVGVRRALGGTHWQVTAVFLRQGLLYLGIGVIGGCLGIVATNLLSGSVPNILTRVVPVTLGVFSLMGLVIFAACYLPTRRAVALEPGDALRYE